MGTMRTVAVFLAVAMCVGAVYAQDESPVQLNTDVQKESYMLGAQVGSHFKGLGADIDVDTFVTAFKDALAGKKLALTDEEMQQIGMSFQSKMMAKRQATQKVESEKNAAAGKAFLEEKAKEEGVKKTDDGLLYQVIEEGTGRTPTDDEMVKANYEVASIDGKVFDSSFERGEPVQFPVAGGMIAGWTEALKLMKEGAKYKFYMPAELAYGEEGRGEIPPSATLVFTIQLLNIVDDYNDAKGVEGAEPAQPDAPQAQPEAAE